MLPLLRLRLTAFGAAGMLEAGIVALKHGSAWLATAWTAHGKPEVIVEASKEFLRMLVAVAMAALSYVGAKTNYRNALKIANNMPTGGLPAMAAVGGRTIGGAQAVTGVSIGPGVGGIGVVGNAAVGLTDKEKASLGEGPDVDRLREKEVGESRAQERHDRQASEGRKSSAGTEGSGVTEDAEGAEGKRRPRPLAGKRRGRRSPSMCHRPATHSASGSTVCLSASSMSYSPTKAGMA